MGVCGGLWRFVVVPLAADAQRCCGAGKLHCNGQPEPTGAGAQAEAGSPALAPAPLCGVLLPSFVASREPEKTAHRAGNAVTALGFFSQSDQHLTVTHTSTSAAPRTAMKACSDPGRWQGCPFGSSTDLDGL